MTTEYLSELVIRLQFHNFLRKIEKADMLNFRIFSFKVKENASFCRAISKALQGVKIISLDMF